MGFGDDAAAIAAALERSRREDSGQRRMQQIISQFDQLTLAQRNLMRPLGEALAMLVGQPVAITGLSPDPESGLVGIIHYATPDGGQHTLTLDRAPSKLASGIVLPN
jgi:hypothetical protein